MSNYSRDSPLVQIILLNYRSWEDTLLCIESLDCLKYENYCVVIVDNNSGDESVKQISEARPDIPLIVNAANVGFGAGNNVGIEYGLDRGADFVWLLNNDTVVDADALNELVHVARLDSRIGAVGSVIHEMDQRNVVQCWGGGRVCLLTGHQRLNTSSNGRLSYLTGASILLRREAVQAGGRFDEHFFFLWEDVDLSFELCRQGWQIAVAEKSIVFHKGGGSEPNETPFRMRHHAKGLVRFLRKHARFPFPRSVPIIGYYAYLAIRHKSLVLFRSGLNGWLEGWKSES